MRAAAHSPPGISPSPKNSAVEGEGGENPPTQAKVLFGGPERRPPLMHPSVFLGVLDSPILALERSRTATYTGFQVWDNVASRRRAAGEFLAAALGWATSLPLRRFALRAKEVACATWGTSSRPALCQKSGGRSAIPIAGPSQ